MSARVGRTRGPCVIAWPDSGSRTVFRRERTGSNQILRTSAVRLGIGHAIGTGSLLMLGLEGRRLHMPLIHIRALLCRGLITNATLAAVKGYAAVPGIIATVNGDAIGIDAIAPCSAGADMHDGCVVCKDSTAPHAAGKADAAIAVAVVNAAIVAHVRAPVAGMKDIKSALPSPIGRSPQSSNERRRHPRAGNPVVAVRAVGPVTGSPHQPRLRAYRLHIYRQHRRREADADIDARMRL